MTQSLTNKCPSSGRIGRSRSLAEFIQRYFSIPKAFKPRSKNEKRVSLNKSNGSNSEYHLTLKQVNKIIATCQNERDAVLIQILAFTGIRRAEMASLKIEDVNWGEKLLSIRNGKGHKQRLVPIPDSALAKLKSLISQRASGPVFQGKTGCALSCRQVNRIVADIGKKSKVNNPNPKYTNITCHLFRHTFARLWKDMNGSIESLSRILGHSSVKTTWDLYGTEGISDIKRNYESIMKKIENSEK